MTRLLHIDSSAAGADSVSRLLGRELVLEWSRRDPQTVLTYRDLHADPLELVTEGWLAAAYTPAEMRDEAATSALWRSEQLIAEIEATDVLILGAPMYNFSIPTALKAWIDQVVRIGRTFGYDGPTPIGLVHGKRAIVLATSGGDARFYEQAGLDHRSSYLRGILDFVGITDIEFVTVTGTAVPELDLEIARAEVAELLDRQVDRALIVAQR